MARLRRASLLLAGLRLVLPARAGAEPPETPRWSARVEAGGEFDSNATRAEIVDTVTPPPPVVASPLARLVATASLMAPLGSAQDLALTASGGGKLFGDRDARGEDVAVAQGALAWRVHLGTRVSAGAQAFYYDAFQRGGGLEARDFRSVTPGARLALDMGGAGVVAVAGGYRLFTFKPDADLDFTAPTAGAEWRHTLGGADEAAEWDVAASASTEPRAFHGPRLTWQCPAGMPTSPSCGPAPSVPPATRDDLFTAARAEVTRVGRFLAGLGYGVEWNRSTSYGESLLRHVVYARAATSLPLGIYLSGRAEILFTRWIDPVLLARAADTSGRTWISVEDEARNSLRLEATRDLGAGLQAVARYTYYTSEIGTTTVHYRRHTALLALAFSVDR